MAGRPRKTIVDLEQRHREIGALMDQQRQARARRVAKQTEARRHGRGAGRPAVLYDYNTNKRTASEWATWLGLRDRRSFYLRLAKWKANPRAFPLSEVFRPINSGAPARYRVAEAELAAREARSIVSPEASAVIMAELAPELDAIMATLPGGADSQSRGATKAQNKASARPVIAGEVSDIMGDDASEN